jgi:hypothetical protein
MTRSLKPQFGSRHRPPPPDGTLGEAPGKRRRFDWQLLTLVALVFVASFVWLF